MTFCPQCGHRMQEKELDGRWREVCPQCGYVLYRNPVPGVGVIVELDGGVVLVRRRYPPQAGKWCLPAGFLEVGESAEEGAIRECREETGLDVEIDDLLGVYSFPEGPQPSGLVIFYTARVVGGTLQAGDDAEEVRVFPLHTLPDDIAFRTHRQVLQRWQQERQRPPELMIAEDLPSSSTSGVRIRPARPEDEPRVLELLPLSAPEVMTEEELRAARQRFRELSTLEVLVAEAQGQVVGFIVLSYIQTLTGPRGWIDDIAVDPSYRRQGIGRMLVEAAVRQARRRGCSYLFVDTAKGNPPARAFYEACGFAGGGVAPLHIR